MRNDRQRGNRSSAAWRRALGAALTGMLLLGLAACGETPGGPETAQGGLEESGSLKTETAQEVGEQSDSGETSGNDGAESGALGEAEDAGAGTMTEPEQRSFEIEYNDGLTLVRNLGPGWVLGNTFDASECSWLTDEMDYEGAWCGVKTTEEMIQAVKDAGFRSVRIPVSWHNHLTDTESYTISEPWLSRVNEVVDYCIDRDLYVILNIHHDNSREFLYPTKELQEQSVRYVTSVWTQLADRFGEYDEHLIFESMNEPRLVGHSNEWWIDPNSQDCKDAIAVINVLNQAFVDTVRESGGNNATRYLLCPGYDASPEGVLDSGFIVPTDPVAENDHRILLEVHAYTPYSFALDYPGVKKWSSANSSDMVNMTSFMDQLYDRYVSRGTPVLIDEFGARNKEDNTESRVDFTATYVTEARKRGMSCLWWDNNVTHSEGENFGIFDRATCTWSFPEIMEAMVEAAALPEPAE